jgi:hypothetical protein
VKMSRGKFNKSTKGLIYRVGVFQFCVRQQETIFFEYVEYNIQAVLCTTWGIEVNYHIYVRYLRSYLEFDTPWCSVRSVQPHDHQCRPRCMVVVFLSSLHVEHHCNTKIGSNILGHPCC